jgi:hypothetical protein
MFASMLLLLPLLSIRTSYARSCAMVACRTSALRLLPP